MSGPKMQNAYPNAISTYPTWVAHATPYTAEWGNSVGFEFYSIEYELGTNPKGNFENVKERLDSYPNFAGFNYYARGYYIHTLNHAAETDIPLYFEHAQNDKDSVFDLIGRRNVTVKVAGWYEITWHAWVEVTSGTFPCELRLYVRKSEAPNYDEVALDFKIMERAGWYTLIAKACTYLNAGQYLYAHITLDESMAIYTRHDWASQGVELKLLDAKPYEVK